MQIVKTDKTPLDIRFLVRNSPLPQAEEAAEVRILIDGEDLLDEESLGPEPRNFFRELQTEARLFKVAIELCSCGESSCPPDTVASVRQAEDEIEWYDLPAPRRSLIFEPGQYREAIAVAAKGWV